MKTAKIKKTGSFHYQKRLRMFCPATCWCWSRSLQLSLLSLNHFPIRTSNLLTLTPFQQLNIKRKVSLVSENLKDPIRSIVIEDSFGKDQQIISIIEEEYDNSIDDDVCNPSPTIINPYCYCCCKNGHLAISREPRVVS